MCGDELPVSAYAHRFGALAVMSPAVSTPSSTSPGEVASLSGSIAFYNDTDHDSSVATHCSDFDDVQLDVPEAPMAPLLRRLRKPLHLHVGEDQDGNRGIIGRRVTMYASSDADQIPATAVAEGIVGYNSLPRMESSL
ncbi:hypothetical protein SEPCBS119000_005008 [Sporothrix epigloea]|uniref:Uncharacterized protein n=1 Tax=Sporothrix epigloea TaxID=1892477 RepID=A0ABP0DX43_9PEZI